MATKVEKIRERKAVLIARLKEIEKEEIAEASAEKTARRKEDTRTKMLLGVVVAMSLKDAPSAAMIGGISLHADKLTAQERIFLATSNLWKELGLPAPQQDASKITASPPLAIAAPAPAPVSSVVTPAMAAPTAPAQPKPATPAPVAPATAQQAKHIATTPTILTKADFYAKETVKALGATYDPESKKWVVQVGRDLTPFQEWL
jgi:hypothetical protein